MGFALIAGTAVSTWQAIRATRSERAAIRAEEAAFAEVDKATAINDFLIGDLLLLAFQADNTASDRIKLEELLDQQADRVGLRFRTRPLLEAGLHSTIGYTYNALGASDKSQRQYALALDIYQREKGPLAVETANAMIGLGQALRLQGAFSEAETLMRPAVDRLHLTLGVEHRDTLFAMLRLAALCESMGKLAEAETLTARVLEVSRRVLGTEHLETMKAMSTLARYFIEEGKLSQAEPLALEAFELFRRVRGEEQDLTLGSMSVVAWLYAAQGKLAEAATLTARVLQDARRVIGSDNDSSLRTTIFLASLYLEQGKRHDAEQILRQATTNKQAANSRNSRMLIKYIWLKLTAHWVLFLSKPAKAMRRRRPIARPWWFPKNWSPRDPISPILKTTWPGSWPLAPSPNSGTRPARSSLLGGPSRRCRTCRTTGTRWAWPSTAPAIARRPPRRF